MKVAFTSTTGEMIDEHFGQSSGFHVWEIGPDEARFLTRIGVIATSGDEEDRIAARAGGGQARRTENPPHEDRHRSPGCRDRRQAPGGAQGEPAAVAQESDEQGK